ncbi:MAG: hypothetical protein AB7Q42_17895 [Acidimicrobiia bacterium]
MNAAKARLAGIALLDRAFGHLPDDELETLTTTLPEDHRAALQRIVGAAEGEELAGTELVEAIRSVGIKGRMNGNLERLAGVVSEPCLTDCIEQLGDRADMPSEEDLLEVAPGLVERHGVAIVRVMLAAAVAGEAPASPAIIRILKHDETLALPAAAPAATPALVKTLSAEEAAERERIKERRKEERRQKQAEQAARREQAARARRSGR